MGFVLGVLSLVLPGALFVLLAHSARLRLRRVEGYALLFYTLLAGWVIQGATGLLNDLLLIAWERIGLERMVFEADAHRTATIWGGMILAAFAAMGINCFRSIDRVSRNVARESGEFRELTYQVAIAEMSPVEVTLETGKSYIGIPVASRVAMKDEGDLWLVLLMSGHRNQRQELNITTSYTEKFDEDSISAPQYDLGDFVVALPKNRIISARPFDVTLSQELFEHREGRA